MANTHVTIEDNKRNVERVEHKVDTPTSNYGGAPSVSPKSQRSAAAGTSPESGFHTEGIPGYGSGRAKKAKKE